MKFSARTGRRSFRKMSRVAAPAAARAPQAHLEPPSHRPVDLGTREAEKVPRLPRTRMSSDRLAAAGAVIFKALKLIK